MARPSNKSVNKNDARYIHCEAEIATVLRHMLTNRKSNIQVKEFCQQAEISRPTFYAHCTDTDDALRQYETRLSTQLIARMPASRGRKEVVFTVLLRFIWENNEYFQATIPNADFWLLQNIFNDLKPKLVGETISQRNYRLYTQQQIGIICCWTECDKYSLTKIPFYVHKLQSTRIIEIEI